MASNNERQDYSIKSIPELIDTFLELSLSSYILAKSNEHGDSNVTNREIKKDVKNTLETFLNGDLQDLIAPDAISARDTKCVIDALKHGIKTYITKMDKELTKSRNELLIKNGTSQPTSPALDAAIMQAAEKSSITQMRQNISAAMERPTNTYWKNLGDICNALGLDKLSEFCIKKNESAMIANAVKSITSKVGTKLKPDPTPNVRHSASPPLRQQS